MLGINIMHRENRFTIRDDSIHASLVNWGAFIRQGMTHGPRENLQGASWQDQVTDRVTAIDEPDPCYIDDDAAERVQDAWVRCRAKDILVAVRIKNHYVYGYDMTRMSDARNKFWRHLY